MKWKIISMFAALLIVCSLSLPCFADETANSEIPCSSSASSSDSCSEAFSSSCSVASDSCSSANELIPTPEPTAVPTIWDKPFDDYTPSEGYLFLIFVVLCSGGLLVIFKKGVF